MICLTSRDLPRTAKGNIFYLQVRDCGAWTVVCALRYVDAVDTLMWLDRHPTRRELRVLVERIG